MWTTSRLIKLQELYLPRLPELVEHFELDVRENANSFYGPCPIHLGDKPTGLVIYKNTSIWRCFTNLCHETWGQGFLGFLRGLLLERDRKSLSMAEIADLVCSILKIQVDNLQHNDDNYKFIADIKILNKEQVVDQQHLTIDYVKAQLEIPPDYYVKRGYEPQILQRYSVGLCNNASKPMDQRIVFPVFDNQGKYVIGCTARSVYEKCSNCKMYHCGQKECPKDLYWLHAKWMNSSKFKPTNHLYNFWNARGPILKSKQLIVVEGPGDVLKLEQAGIHNGIGLFGANMSEEQRVLIEKSGAQEILIATDNDEAGKKAQRQIYNKLHRLFKVKTLEFTKKDVAELSEDEIRGLVNDT